MGSDKYLCNLLQKYYTSEFQLALDKNIIDNYVVSWALIQCIFRITWAKETENSIKQIPAIFLCRSYEDID